MSTKPVHPALREIHDVLYRVREGGKHTYEPDKGWDADTTEAIAEIVARYIPRPQENRTPSHGKCPQGSSPRRQVKLNLARLLYDAYPHSDLLPINPGTDCVNLPALLHRVRSDDIGDSLFAFLVIEIVEGGESTLPGAVRVLEQARDDVEAVLQAFIEAQGTASTPKESM